jgi:DNA-binding response OmpR family regulator
VDGGMAAQERATILVAEDNERLRSLLTSLLELEGYRVLEAADGVRMDRLLVEQEVDALILDVRFGSDDGIGLGRELREELPRLPIALINGDSSAAETVTRAAGVTDLFLSKPFTLAELRRTVEELLERRTR